MQRKQLQTLFAGLVSGVALCCLGSCGNGPQVTIYLSDPANGGMEYYDETTSQKGFVNYAQTDKFVCLNQNDAATLFNYCKLGAQK